MRGLLLSSLALCFASIASADPRLWSVQSASQPKTQHRNVIRVPKSSAPVKDLTSEDLRCGRGGNVPASEWLKVETWDDLWFEYYNQKQGDQAIGAEDKGVWVAYIAKAETEGKGPVWTKISDWGRGVVRPAWPSDDIRLPTHQHNKQWIFMIPIPAGKWLLRTEWIVLRDASVSYLEDPSKGAEFYPTCIQIDVQKTTDSVSEPPAGISFPGSYKYDDEGILYDVHDPKNDRERYPTPGGDIWDVADCNGPGLF